MQLLPELKEKLNQLENADIDSLTFAADALDMAGLSDEADTLREKIAELEEEWEDVMLAQQELKDGGF